MKSSKKKVAIITGITGQDGSYLSEFLLNKGYKVIGIIRRSSLIKTDRINSNFNNKNLKLMYGDLIDANSLYEIISETMPDEIYNLAAQSHVKVSFEIPEYTSNVNALGTLRILEIIKKLRTKKKIKFYQASSSELYGKVIETPQNEETAFYPRSPYGVSKMFAYWMTINYREAYNLFACNGILFNHESPRRGETFVTRKIVIGLCKIKLGLLNCLSLGNLDAKRDWGHAKDYVEMQWKMLQQKKPIDYVISTGQMISVRDFTEIVLDKLNIKIKWIGKGMKEKGVDISTGKTIIKVDKKYYRPTEVDILLGDSSKAFKNLKWKPSYNIKSMIDEMIESENINIDNELKLKKNFF